MRFIFLILTFFTLTAVAKKQETPKEIKFKVLCEKTNNNHVDLKCFLNFEFLY